MKKHSFKIFMKRLSGAFLVATVISVNTNAAEIPADTALHETTATVKYVGTDNNSYVFNVVYNNDNGEKFLVRITDDGGNVLFTQTYTDKKFDKRFRLLKEDIGGKLNFTIKNLKDNSIQTFQVTTTEQVVEDVVVKKVNG
jgi:hypothetical protein